jgi:hypothetical protein
MATRGATKQVAAKVGGPGPGAKASTAAQRGADQAAAAKPRADAAAPAAQGAAAPAKRRSLSKAGRDVALGVGALAGATYATSIVVQSGMNAKSLGDCNSKCEQAYGNGDAAESTEDREERLEELHDCMESCASIIAQQSTHGSPSGVLSSAMVDIIKQIILTAGPLIAVLVVIRLVYNKIAG